MKFSFLKIRQLFCGYLIVLSLSASWALAQDVSVDAEVDSMDVVLGSAATLTISIQGSQDVLAPNLPAMDGFDAQYIGPSQRVSIVNGQYSSSISHMYSLLTLKVGQFEIPALEIEVSGNVYKTQPIKINVIDSSSKVAATSPTQPSAQSLKDKVFLVLKSAKDKAYINSRVPVKVFMFVNGIAIRDIQYPQIDPAGFSLSDFGQPRQHEQMINGIRYEILEFDAALYPMRSGELKVGPAKVNCNILVKSGIPHSAGRMGSILDDEFFNDFFNRYDKRPAVLESSDLTINVQELPENGKPLDFSNGVGHFAFDAILSPSEVKEGDPLTLRMEINGDGNLASVKFPVFNNLPGFKTYDPTIKEQNGEKVFEQVLIPTNAQLNEVPAITFSYFDDEAGIYRSLKKGPFPIRVTKDPEGVQITSLQPSSVASVVKIKKEEKLGQDIVFIKEGMGRIYPKGERVSVNLFYWFFVLFFLGSWAGAMYFFYHTHRLKTDVVFARKLKAPQDAKRRLKEARELLRNKRDADFYDAVLKMLQHYVSGKFHLSPGSALDIHVISLRLVLKDQNQKKKILDDIQTTFDECEMIRYASASFDAHRMETTLKRVEGIVDSLERNVK